MKDGRFIIMCQPEIMIIINQPEHRPCQGEQRQEVCFEEPAAADKPVGNHPNYQCKPCAPGISEQ